VTGPGLDPRGASRDPCAARALPEGERSPGWDASPQPGGANAHAGRLRIALAMIVRNEAARLPACLASVGGAVDEIVVVDTGSTDRTPDVARSAGARVIDWPWRDDFAAARNASLAQASGDWVLVLDADEQLAPGSAATLRGIVERTSAAGLDCRLVSTLPADQPAPSLAAWYCRVFEKSPGVRFAGRVHEQIAPSIRAAGGRIERSDVTILHAGYAEPSDEKLARNLRLLGLDLAERPDDAFALFSLGLTLQAAGRWDEAVEPLERAIASERSPLARDLRAVAHTKLAEGWLRARRWTDAERVARAALELVPDLTLARYALGRARFEQEAFEDAAGEFSRLAEAPADSLGMTLHARLPLLALALCRLRQRRFAEAAAALEPVAGSDRSGEATFQLGNAYLGQGDLVRAAAAYRAARARGMRHGDLDRRLALADRLAVNMGGLDGPPEPPGWH
jgi:glycosyl transferase family 2/tetratricopeptide repeat protein